jgi:adiponectin receptor
MRAVGLTLLFDIIGAVVYATQFPERWWRRRFDIFGASHQLMHSAIVFAALAWLSGTITAFDNLHAMKAAA